MGLFSALFNREKPEDFMKRTLGQLRLNYMDYLTQDEYDYIMSVANNKANSIDDCQNDPRSRQIKSLAIARMEGRAPEPEEGYHHYSL